MENYLRTTGCPCGRVHDVAIDEVAVGKSVIRRIPEFVEKYGAVRPFVLADVNTFAAVSNAVKTCLESGYSGGTGRTALIHKEIEK